MKLPEIIGIPSQQESEKLSKQEKKEQEVKSTNYELITQDEINTNIEKIPPEFNINLGDVIINKTKPGDNLFEKHEIEHKLFLKCDSNFEKMLDKIRSHGYDPKKLFQLKLYEILQIRRK